MKTALTALCAVLLFALTGPMLLGDKEASGTAGSKAKKKVVFMAGHRSHGYDQHEHRAGCLLLSEQLNKHMGHSLESSVQLAKDWPGNFSELEDADCIIFYCDGGGRHMAYQHLDGLDVKLKDGCGLACLHYGVEVPGGDEKGRQTSSSVGWAVTSKPITRSTRIGMPTSRKLPEAPHHTRRETIQDPRRVVLPHAVCKKA